MKIFILVFALALSSSIVEADIISDCERKWPDDYRMQKYCIDEQRKARADVQKYKAQMRALQTQTTEETARYINKTAVDDGACVVERQNIADINGVGLAGTAQHTKAKEALEECMK